MLLQHTLGSRRWNRLLSHQYIYTFITCVTPMASSAVGEPGAFSALRHVQVRQTVVTP